MLFNWWFGITESCHMILSTLGPLSPWEKQLALCHYTVNDIDLCTVSVIYVNLYGHNRISAIHIFVVMQDNGRHIHFVAWFTSQDYLDFHRSARAMLLEQATTANYKGWESW